MEKLLIHFDESNYKVQVSAFEDAAQLLQEGVEQYNSMGLLKLSASEFYSLFKDPANLVLDKLTGGEPVKLNGLAVQRKYAFEILEKPKGLDALIAKIEEVLQKLQSDLFPPYNVRLDGRTLNQFFELNEAGEVVIKELLIAKLESSNKMYAETPAAKNMFEFAKAVLEKAEECELRGIVTKSVPDLLHELLDSYSTYDAINLKRIAQYNSNTAFKTRK